MARTNTGTMIQALTKKEEDPTAGGLPPFLFNRQRLVVYFLQIE
jgi:hypothetical protein